MIEMYGWYDELKLLKGTHVCRSNTHPDMKSHVIERLATDHHGATVTKGC